jgi:aminoglycoside phosphotransferase (APT) family kinase protein
VSAADQQDILYPASLPWLEITEKLGSITEIRAVGWSQSTYILQTGKGRVVVKRMAYDREPNVYLELLTRLAEMRSRFCPRLLGTVCTDEDYWYALFEWMDGSTPPFPPSEIDFVWQAIIELLKRMRNYSLASEWFLDSMWLDRLGEALSDVPSASLILERLRCSIPNEHRSLAHGDFSVQNLLCHADGLVLLDWEEVGSAPAGFDAGWMLALARIGHAPLLSYTAMRSEFLDAGFPETNLHWFEMLGMLRLLFRARTLLIDPGVRERILVFVQREVIKCAEHMS